MDASQQQETERLTQFARDAERTLPDDLDWHIWAWQAVLKVDPDAAEAQGALARLLRQKADAEVSMRLVQLVPQAQRAATHNQYGELAALLKQLEVWRAQGEQTPPGLSAAIYQQVVEAQEHVDALREETLGRLAYVSDLLVTHNYREAYRQARTALERGVLKLVDRAVGAEVDTETFYRDARDRFLNALRQFAIERVSQAEEAGRENPERALDILREARGQLIDDVLTIDDRGTLRPQRELIDRKLEETGRQWERFKTARARVIEAHKKSGAEALTLLRIAREDYPDYPRLESYIAALEAQQAASVAAQVATAVTEARRLAGQHAYTAALRALAEARRQAVQQSASQATLAEIETAEASVVAEEQAYEALTRLLAEVDAALAQAEGGDTSATSLARALLDQLSTAEAQTTAARTRRARLTVLDVSHNA